jgi:hypothetical protein
MADETNVYDLGWRRNLEAVFGESEEGEDEHVGEEGVKDALLGGLGRSRRERVRKAWRYLLWLWPGSRSQK